MNNNKDINISKEVKIILLNICHVHATVLGALQHLRALSLQTLFTKCEPAVKVNDVHVCGPVMWHLFLKSLYNIVVLFQFIFLLFFPLPYFKDTTLTWVLT